MYCYLVKKKPAEAIKVNILSEERGYNAYNREYRTLLIDRPLFAEVSRPLIKNILNYRNRNSLTSLRLTKESQLKDHEDCSRFLEAISQQVVSGLECDVRRLHSNYMILSQYLTDAANRHKELAESYIGKFENCFEIGEASNCDSLRRSIRIAVENYVVYLMHGKLMAAVYQQYSQEEYILKSNYARIESTTSTVCDLGAQQSFVNFSVTNELLSEMNKLPLLQSPLSIVNCLIKVTRMISQGLTGCVAFERVLNPIEDDEQLSICSDDLIASFTFALVRANVSNLYSVSKYLEIFGWSTIERDQAAYCIATFQIVVQYILDYRGDDTRRRSASRIEQVEAKPESKIANNHDGPADNLIEGTAGGDMTESNQVNTYPSNLSEVHGTAVSTDNKSKDSLRVDWEVPRDLPTSDTTSRVIDDES